MISKPFLTTACITGILGLVSLKPQCPDPADAQVRVATWNINWLNQHDRAGLNPRTPVHYQALQRYASQLGADLVALQEVDGPEAARRVFDPEEYTFVFSSRDNVQRVGFAVKKSLRITRHPDLVSLARVDSERLRYGVDLSVHWGKGRTLRVLNVHLKSGCFTDPLDSTSREACVKLAKQWPILERWVAKRHEEGVAFMITGDFNRQLKPWDDAWRKLEGSSPSTTFHVPTMTVQSKCWGGRHPELIDHMVLGNQAVGMWQKHSFGQHLYDPQDRARFGVKLSDHCPVSSVFR